MSRLVEDYRKLLQSLMPKGEFWTRDENSNLTKLWKAVSQEFKRIDDRGQDLVTERQVQLTNELITEHEEDYGIPEEGDSLQPTIALRKNELHSALLRVGQQNKEYYEEIADALGYTVEIEEYQPFWVGYSTIGASVGDQYNLFYWLILIDATLITRSIDVNISKLIRKIVDVKPGHTTVLFDWNNVGFSRGFSDGFSSKPHYDNSWYGLGFGNGFSNGFANAYDYDGVNYTGGFNYGFSIGFNRRSGGGFHRDGFSSGFTRPS